LLVDITVIGALLTVGPSQWSSASAPRTSKTSCSLVLPFCAAAISGLLLSASSSWFEVQYSDDLESLANGTIARIVPAKWVGNRCPLLRYLDVGGLIAKGSWRIIFFYRDCNRCREAIASAIADQHTDSTTRLCLVEIPPYDGPLIKTSDVVLGKLEGHHRWSVEAPAEMILSDGVVVSGRSGFTSKQPVEK
jgi:hypothetical protein